MKVRHVIAAVNRLAPFELAEPWDHVGLQVGAPGDELRAAHPHERDVRPSVLVTLEVDDAALDEARRLGSCVVVSHHPLIFAPLERLTDEDPSARLSLRAAREGVAVIAAHTSLDKARGGIADVIAGMLGLEATAPLAPAAADACKLVGFVPEDDVDLVRTALFAAGAGVIGEYEHCSWSVGGQGTFFGREGTAPVAGVAGRDERVDEIRLEVVFPRRLRRRIVSVYVDAHPYEEPAYDLYPVENEHRSLGLGRLGELPAPTTLAAFAADVAAVLGLPAVRYAGDPERRVRRVALLPGSGAEAIARGVAGVADVLVTGDVKYHEARSALGQGLALVDAPHGITEQAAVLRWARTLAEALGPEVHVDTFADPGVSVWEVTSHGARRAQAGEGGEDEAEETGEEAASVHVEAELGGREMIDAHGPPMPPLDEPERDSVHREAGPDDARYRLYTDGGARGNPGPAGIGVRLLTAEGTLVDELSDVIGDATNNVAEYEALLAGLELALDRGVERLTVFMDSELVVRQLNGQYKVKNADLKALHAEAARRLRGFREVDVKHIRREQNSDADRLVNEALDRAGH
jgi:dinuclear metal center YbgI/SA1388 family protein